MFTKVYVVAAGNIAMGVAWFVLAVYVISSKKRLMKEGHESDAIWIVALVFVQIGFLFFMGSACLLLLTELEKALKISP